ncbi:MAG: transglycosylase SLT domain-containing protein [Muribaculaceae bacterium]|nr:transglycosylase SLT domain-containing protein [Muribaculaceae bacterium]
MKMKSLHIRLLPLAFVAIAAFPALSQKKSSNVLDLKHSIEDSAIVFPESFETDTRQLMERWYLKNYTSSNLETTTDYDPGASDAEIRRRLADLPTVIDMPYNDIVRQYIERYTKKGRKQVTALLGLSSYYMPIFEQALEEAGLPLELKYLPVIESGLDPNATSRHGAAGLWQFMLASGRGYDMEVTSLVDERRDPYISSQRACRMLKDLYDSYGDWSLAIAAYNCGPGTVNKALVRAGGDPANHDFWSIYYYLPAETRGYVPAFIAANYVMTYYPEHGIAPVLVTKPLVTDTVHLTERVHFNQIAAVLDIPVEEIRILNPQFRADIIPASADKPYNLILPSQQMHAYLVSEDQILAYESEKYARKTDATPGGDPNAVVEEVVETETLNPADPAPVEAAAAEIAYEETHPEEREATATPRRRRSEGTVKAAEAQPAQSAKATAAKTPKTEQAAQTPASSKKATPKKETAKKETKPKTSNHTVASGENLTTIAKKHGITVEQLKKANPKLKGDMLHPGDKLTVPAKTSTSKSGSTGAKKKKKR